MKLHYHTQDRRILCEQKSNNIRALGRFSFIVGKDSNCKKCEKLLIQHKKNNYEVYPCISYNLLGYNTDCQWRENNYCYCVDDCAFKYKKNENKI